MNYKQLGKTDFKVSEISIGTEHLGRCSQKTINDVFKYSVENGFNYFDILTGSEVQREKFGRAVNGLRDKIYIAGHFYSKTRDIEDSRQLFDNFLKQLNINYVDILFIQYVDKSQSQFFCKIKLPPIPPES